MVFLECIVVCLNEIYNICVYIFTKKVQGKCTVSNEANGLLPLCAMVERGTCGFSFVNRTQQRVRGLPRSSSWYVRL